jgi:hypothetical protein
VLLGRALPDQHQTGLRLLFAEDAESAQHQFNVLLPGDPTEMEYDLLSLQSVTSADLAPVQARIEAVQVHPGGDDLEALDVRRVAFYLVLDGQGRRYHHLGPVQDGAQVGPHAELDHPLREGGEVVEPGRLGDHGVEGQHHWLPQRPAGQHGPYRLEHQTVDVYHVHLQFGQDMAFVGREHGDPVTGILLETDGAEIVNALLPLRRLGRVWSQDIDGVPHSFQLPLGQQQGGHHPVTGGQV